MSCTGNPPAVMNGCRWTEPSYRTGYLKDNYPSSSGSSSSSGSGSLFESSSGSSDVSTQYTNIVVTAANDVTPNFYDVLLGLSISNSTCSTVQRNYDFEEEEKENSEEDNDDCLAGIKFSQAAEDTGGGGISHIVTRSRSGAQGKRKYILEDRVPQKETFLNLLILQHLEQIRMK